jgi:hypothetical protein
MFTQVNEANDGIGDAIKQLFTDIIGTESQGAGGGAYVNAPVVGDGERYTVAQLVQLAASVGLATAAAAIAGAVAYAESTGNPTAVNGHYIGLWQIGDPSIHPSLHLSTSDLQVPEKNASAMKTLSSNGTNWDQWTTFTGADTPNNEKTYLRYLAEAKKAAQDIANGKTYHHPKSDAARKASDTIVATPLTDFTGLLVQDDLSAALKGSGYKTASVMSVSSISDCADKISDGRIKLSPVVYVQVQDDLGASTAAFTRDAKKLMSLIGKDRQVFWTLPFRRPSTNAVDGAAFAVIALSGDYPNITTLDLASAVQNGKVSLIQDGMTPSVAGSKAWAKIVARAIRGGSSTGGGAGTSTANGAAPAATHTNASKADDPALRQKLLNADTLKGLYGSGSAALDGAGTGLIPIANLAMQMGLTPSAGAAVPKGHHSYYVSGTNRVSNHSSGLAQDYAEGAQDDAPKQKFWEIMHRMKGGLKELIYSHHGYNSDQGDYYYAGDDHHNHVHVAVPDQYRDDPNAMVSLVMKAMAGQDVTLTDANGQTVSAQSGGSAFATYINAPTLEASAEAIGLRGQKSLLNDVSLLPFVQQLTDASLRSFQSMPNGNFFAFFPDYFGGFGKGTPYWLVDDIEIQDGKINLTDDYLATHVFVVGDIVDYGHIDFADRLQSGGVMDIASALKTGFIKTPTDSDQAAGLGIPATIDHSYIVKFLERYGVRPKTEEMAMIRSPYFELFVAYQRFMELWAKQFASTFTMTFMPEVYPGGIVGFPNHGIQCYVQEVVHTFDYEEGFETQATLMAPAAMRGSSDVSAGMVRGYDFTDNNNATVENYITGVQKVDAAVGNLWQTALQVKNQQDKGKP